MQRPHLLSQLRPRALPPKEQGGYIVSEILPHSGSNFKRNPSQVRIVFGTGKRITPELTRRPTTATTWIEPINDHERQAEGSRVE
jgi:hypothetical protein